MLARLGAPPGLIEEVCAIIAHHHSVGRMRDSLNFRLLYDADLLVNLGEEPFCVEPGMRIAQLVVAPAALAEVEVTSELDETRRGRGGFGSTGG